MSLPALPFSLYSSLLIYSPCVTLSSLCASVVSAEAGLRHHTALLVIFRALPRDYETATSATTSCCRSRNLPSLYCAHLQQPPVQCGGMSIPHLPAAPFHLGWLNLDPMHPPTIQYRPPQPFRARAQMRAPRCRQTYPTSLERRGKDMSQLSVRLMAHHTRRTPWSPPTAHRHPSTNIGRTSLLLDQTAAMVHIMPQTLASHTAPRHSLYLQLWLPTHTRAAHSHRVRQRAQACAAILRPSAVTVQFRMLPHQPTHTA